MQLPNRALSLNKQDPSVEPLRERGRASNKNLRLEEGLLLYNRRLVVPDTENLRTELVKEAYNQPSVAYPRVRKTLAVLKPRYYWLGIKAFVTRFVSNCYPCKRAHLLYDKSPSWLYSLPVF